jgi:hypothetical protein
VGEGRNAVQVTEVLPALTGPETEVGQALAVLESAGVEGAAALPVSLGDRELVDLARTLAGAELELVARCPHCELLSEIVLAPESFPEPAPRVAALGRGGIREPTYGDLLDLPDDAEAATAELLRRCTVGAPERAPGPDELELVDDALSGPLEFSCAGCEGPVTLDVDVQQVALSRLGELARGLEREVHLLATAYGWTLAEIESLPDARRRRLALLVGEGR